MEARGAKKLKALEDENRRIKKLLADTLLENATVKRLLTKKCYRVVFTESGGLSPKAVEDISAYDVPDGEAFTFR